MVESPESAASPGLARRLFIAGILVVLTALVCWLLLPYAGVHVPWWVPVLAFAVIIVGAVARAKEAGGEGQDDPEIAGRIGGP